MNILTNNLSSIYLSYFIVLALAWNLYINDKKRLSLYIVVSIVSLHFVLGGLIAVNNPIDSLKERYLNIFGLITVPTDILLLFPLLYFGQWLFNKADLSVTRNALLAATIGNTGCVMVHLLKE